MKPRIPSAAPAEADDDLRPLSALVDGELSDGERAAVEQGLAGNPAHAEAVAHYRAQKHALQALFPLPTDVPSLFIRKRVPWWHWAGGAAACLLFGTLLGWRLPALLQQEPAFAMRADLAYSVFAPEKRHPVEVPASEQAHLVAWLSKRLSHPLTAPSLQEYGYQLVGGRLLTGDAGPAALLMYQNAAGARLTLYATPAAGKDRAIRTLQRGARRTEYWASSGMGYALSGLGDEAGLQRIADDVCVALGGTVNWPNRSS